MKITTKHMEWNKTFNIQENEEGYITSLQYKNDANGMNWFEGNRLWGEAICPDTLQVKIGREYTIEGNLTETYRVKNISKFPVMLKKTDIGIYTTFNENYEEAKKCLETKCHTHIFCGKQAAYIMALRMSGIGKNLGLKLRKGSIGSYSVERDLSKRSDDRGDFILHPEIERIEPGQIITIEWELFWFDTRVEFYDNLLETPGFPVALINQSTFFPGEVMKFKVGVRGITDSSFVMITIDNKSIAYTTSHEDGITWIYVEYIANYEGAHRFELDVLGKNTYVLLYSCAKLDTMAYRRCAYLAEKQQMQDTDSPLDGAYLIYDKEEESLYYNHETDDHNGGRERLGMGALMALWLQNNRNEQLEDSLKKYVEYVYRELYKRGAGVVCNDIRHNLDWNRMYNYPWMATFQIELYRLWNRKEFLEDAYQVMKHYYQNGGTEFYAIGIQVWELREELIGANMILEAECLEKYAVAHAEKICENSTHYPASEVAYEQSIVAPAVSCLLQGYQITKKELYLKEAEKQLSVLSLFNGEQPDYHLYENAIRHWDGFWFGKYRMYGDTFPHYWSVLTGVEFARYTDITEDKRYMDRALASLRGCLNLFFSDGFASCAMVFPESVNGKRAHYYDPWANDQDWALYYAIKYRKLTESDKK